MPCGGVSASTGRVQDMWETHGASSQPLPCLGKSEGTGATLVVTGALLVVTRSYLNLI